MNLDLFPTLHNIAGVKLPKDRAIDGRDLSSLLLNPKSKPESRELFYYHQGVLESMRSDHWKYVQGINHYIWPMPDNRKHGKLSEHTTGPLPMLFDLRNDPGESYNLADRYPDLVTKLDATMNRWKD